MCWKNRRLQAATLAVCAHVTAGLLALGLTGPLSAQSLAKVPGTSVLKKVVAASDNITAMTARGGGSAAFKMPVLKPFFVVAEEGEYLKITDQQESGGRTGYVKKAHILEWNTREGLHFQPSNLIIDGRPEVKVWPDRARIEQYARTGNATAFPPSYTEDKNTSRALPPNLLPYPVLGSARIKTAGGTEKRIYRVLIPAYTEGATAEVRMPQEKIRKVLSKVTFCIVFDATASMRDYAKSMAATIEELLRSIGSSGIDLKDISVGFVFFRDLDDEERVVIINPAPLEAAVSRLRSEAEKMNGGGEEAEPVLDAATIAATEFKWSGSSQEGAKKVAIVVLNDDAKKTTAGLSPGVAKGLSATEVGALLSKQRITVYALQAGSNDGGNLEGTLQTLANQTSGEYYPYNKDSMKVSRDFSSHVKNLFEGTSKDALEDSRTLLETALPGDREYTVLPLKALDSETISRLEEAAGELNIKEGGLAIREGWMFELNDLYEQQVLVEKETIEQLVAFFRLLSDTSASCDDLKGSVVANLRTMLGEDIDAGAELQELVEKQLGVHFNTAILSFSLEHLCGFTPKERLALQSRIGEAGGKLANFLEAATPELNKQSQTWMKLSLLP